VENGDTTETNEMTGATIPAGTGNIVVTSGGRGTRMAGTGMTGEVVEEGTGMMGGEGGGKMMMEVMRSRWAVPRPGG
jgi:hypothetical protein